jgi:protein MpaA
MLQAAHVQTAPTVLSATSRHGRPIAAFHTGIDGRRRVLVFGEIHGNERAGVAIAEQLINQPTVPDTDIWVVPELNPDGAAADTRQNADGVDLNRNFPYRWYAHGSRGDWDYDGPRPLSEPESRFAYRLIERLHPAITIWFHQAERTVDLSGGSATLEGRFGRLVGLPVTRLTRYPGSGSTWQNHRFPGTTSFVVELPGGTLSAAAVERYTRAIVTIAGGRTS